MEGYLRVLTSQTRFENEVISNAISEMRGSNKWSANMLRDLERSLKKHIESISAEADFPLNGNGKTPLTRKQKQVLDYVKKYVGDNGYAPTLDEIVQYLGIKSKSTVHLHLRELEKRGYIERKPKSRFINILDSTIEGNNGSKKIGDNTFLASDLALEKAKRSILNADLFDEAHQILLLSHILGIANARNISLYMVNYQDEMLVPRIWQGSWDEGQQPRKFAYGEGIAGNVWKKGKGFVSKGDVQIDPAFVPSSSRRSKKAKSLMVIPIIDFNGDFVGVVNLDSYRENQFSNKLRDDIEAASKQASKLMGNSDLSQYVSNQFSVGLFLLLFNEIISKRYHF